MYKAIEVECLGQSQTACTLTWAPFQIPWEESQDISLELQDSRNHTLKTAVLVILPAQSLRVE